MDPHAFQNRRDANLVSMFHLNPIPIDGPDLGNKRPETADGLELQLNGRTTEFREAFDAGNQLAERRLFECGTLHGRSDTFVIDVTSVEELRELGSNDLFEIGCRAAEDAGRVRPGLHLARLNATDAFAQILKVRHESDSPLRQA